MEKMSAGKKAHLYALMAWNDISKEEALKTVNETEYADLNGKTWAESSVEASIDGLRKQFGLPEGISPEGDFSAHKLEGTDVDYVKVVGIVVDIHDKWVRDNAKKYDRGNEEKSDKNLFQHTPTALIGLDEVAKDLMFLAPFLEEMGLDVGTMKLETYGSFVPSEKFAQAYQRYVDKYMEKNNIHSSEELEDHVKDCINGGYAPLAGESELNVKRREYMMKKLPKLLEVIKAKNAQQLGALPSQSQPE